MNQIMAEWRVDNLSISRENKIWKEVNFVVVSQYTGMVAAGCGK